LLADVYAEMIGAGSTQRNLLFSSTTNQGFEAAMQNHFTNGNKIFREARQFKIAEDELAAHEELMNSLKDPLWKKLA